LKNISRIINLAPSTNAPQVLIKPNRWRYIIEIIVYIGWKRFNGKICLIWNNKHTRTILEVHQIRKLHKTYSDQSTPHSDPIGKRTSNNEKPKKNIGILLDFVYFAEVRRIRTDWVFLDNFCWSFLWRNVTQIDLHLNGMEITQKVTKFLMIIIGCVCMNCLHSLWIRIMPKLRWNLSASTNHTFYGPLFPF